MKRLGFLITLAALALSLLNCWQIFQLREQLGLASKSPIAAVAEPKKGSRHEVQELLGSAQKHSSRAKQLMAKGDSKGARAEMQKSLDALSEAEALATAQTNGFREAFSSARQKIEGVLASFGSETPAKGAAK